MSVAEHTTSRVDGLSMVERAVSIVHLAARRGATDFGDRVAQTLGTPPPDGPRFTQSGALRLLGIAPGRWLVVQAAVDQDFCADLAARLRSVAAVCDMSDAYMVLQLRGAAVRPTLAKLIAIDLHAAAFSAGQVAATVASHIPLIIWREADEGGPVFELAVSRSYGLCLREVLDEAAAEFLPPNQR